MDDRSDAGYQWPAVATLQDGRLGTRGSYLVRREACWVATWRNLSLAGTRAKKDGAPTRAFAGAARPLFLQELLVRQPVIVAVAVESSSSAGQRAHLLGACSLGRAGGTDGGTAGRQLTRRWQRMDGWMDCADETSRLPMLEGVPLLGCCSAMPMPCHCHARPCSKASRAAAGTKRARTQNANDVHPLGLLLACCTPVRTNRHDQSSRSGSPFHFVPLRRRPLIRPVCHHLPTCSCRRRLFASCNARFLDHRQPPHRRRF